MTLTAQLRDRQLPGRPEALQLAIQGTASPLQRQIAGLHCTHAQRPALPFCGSVRYPDDLSAQERDSLPF